MLFANSTVLNIYMISKVCMQVSYPVCLFGSVSLNLLHSERPKLYTILAFLSAVELKQAACILAE